MKSKRPSSISTKRPFRPNRISLMETLALTRTRILGMQMSLVEEPSKIETPTFRSPILILSVSSKTLALWLSVLIQQEERQTSRSLTLSIISLRHLAGPSASDRQVSRPSSQRTC